MQTRVMKTPTDARSVALFKAAAPVTSPRVRLKSDRADRVGNADRRSGPAEFANEKSGARNSERLMGSARK
jgi:hypothetical protein